MARAALREVPGHFLRGAAMGAANLMPGVSGGTVALVLDVYVRLVASIRAGSSALGVLLRGDRRRGIAALRAADGVFLIPLGVGVLTAVLVLAPTVESLLESHPVPMSGLFLGLVAGSVLVALGLLPDRGRREWTIILVTAAAFFVVLGFTAEEAAQHAAGQAALWEFFVAGAVAGCSMVLPALSGSFVLVVMGMYQPLLHAVTERDSLMLAAVMAGAVVGLALFSQVLHWLLAEHHRPFMALMLGLMTGSLRLLWPWPGGAESAALGLPDEAVVGTVLATMGGFVAVVAVDALAHRLERRNAVDEVEDLHAV